METITSSREIDSLFRRGRRSRRTTLVVLCGKTPEGRSSDGRVVYVAGRRMGNAVYRNRCKRVMRAAVARAHASWPGWDIALVATAKTGTAKAETLEQDLVEGVRAAIEST